MGRRSRPSPCTTRRRPCPSSRLCRPAVRRPSRPPRRPSRRRRPQPRSARRSPASFSVAVSTHVVCTRRPQSPIAVVSAFSLAVSAAAAQSNRSLRGRYWRSRRSSRPRPPPRHRRRRRRPRPPSARRSRRRRWCRSTTGSLLFFFFFFFFFSLAFSSVVRAASASTWCEPPTTRLPHGGRGRRSSLAVRSARSLARCPPRLSAAAATSEAPTASAASVGDEIVPPSLDSCEDGELDLIEPSQPPPYESYESLALYTGRPRPRRLSATRLAALESRRDRSLRRRARRCSRRRPCHPHRCRCRRRKRWTTTSHSPSRRDLPRPRRRSAMRWNCSRRGPSLRARRSRSPARRFQRPRPRRRSPQRSGAARTAA